MLKSFLFIIVSVHSIILFPQKASVKKPGKWEKSIQNWLQKDSVPGMFIIVAKDGQILEQKGYGYSNLELLTKPTSKTVFEIASITKMFTGIGVCMLWEQGKLDLDSSITKYIDSLPQSWAAVTVRHLLYHAAGLNPQHFDETKLTGPPILRYSVDEQLRFFKNQKQLVAPGTISYYTNSEFFLLGVIIQNVSGKTYQEFIQKNIFDKAGMKNSSLIDAQAIIPNRAQGYTLRNGKHVRWMLEQNIQSLDCNSFAGILSTADDLLLFENALRTYSFVNKETYNKMLQPFVLTNGKPASPGKSNWGMGCSVRDIQGHMAVSHLGHTGTAFFRFPKENIVIIILSNLSNGYELLKDKGANMPDNGFRLAEEIITSYK